MILATASAAMGQARRPPRRKPVAPLQQNFELASQINTPFSGPVELPAVGGVFPLTLTKNRFADPNATAIDPSVPKVFDLICYNGQKVAPTIRVRRGTTFRIRVHNALHGPVDPGPDPIDGSNPWEVPHGLCNTNLHTHGLHVSPSANHDNVYLQIEPGKTQLFEYQIGPNHSSGTFWYHPHKHGSVGYQVSNGAAGALIVEGRPGDKIADLDDIPEIAAAQERILVLHWYTYSTYNAGGTKIGFIDASSIYNINPNNLSTCMIVPPRHTVTSDPSYNVLAVNGQLVPTITMAPGEVERWRIVHAGWDVGELLTWYRADGVTRAPEVELYEIALDGLATGAMSPIGGVDIAPGQRTDILIRAPRIPRGGPATYYLKRLGKDDSVGKHGDPSAEVVVAKLVVGGPPHPMALPSNPAALARCRPFAPIEDSELVAPTIPNGTLTLAAEDPPNPPSFQGAFYTINGKTFHQQTPIRLTLGTAQQWTLKAGMKIGGQEVGSGHPFHIHINPFQVISYTDPSGVTTPMNVWRDTLHIPQGASYVIRSRYQDYTGLSVLHCHILDHEDQGMMVPILLVNPDGSTADGSQPPKSSLAKSNAPAPPLRLTDTGGTIRDLADFRGRKVVLVFFRGIRCGHCAQDLRALVRDARNQQGNDLDVVAVSDVAVPDPAQALKLLGVVDSDRFHLLVDEKKEAFRAFGCAGDGEPRHGLFIVDRAGVIRSSYVGEVPFGDSGEVFARARQLAAAAPARPAGN